MSWKAEVIADSSGQWVANQLRFLTKLEAERYLWDLSGRWTAVRYARSVECDEPVNAMWTDKGLEHLDDLYPKAS